MGLHKCIIKPVLVANTILSGKLWNNELKRNEYLTMNGDIRINSLPEGEPMFRHEFPDKISEFIFEWDDRDKTHKGSKMREFFLRHNNVKCETEENKNLLTELFVLIDEKSVNVETYDKIVKIGKALSAYMALSYDEKKNAAFAFGIDPLRRTERELLIDLFEPNIGTIYFEDKESENKISYVDNFLDLFGSEQNRKKSEIKIYTRKAIAMGIITEKDGTFYLNKEAFASNEGQLMAWMASNEFRFQTQVKDAVELKDTYGQPSDIDSLPKPNTKKAKKEELTPYTVDEYMDLMKQKDRAKLAGDADRQKIVAEAIKNAKAYFKSQEIDIEAKIKELANA